MLHGRRPTAERRGDPSLELGELLWPCSVRLGEVDRRVVGTAGPDKLHPRVFLGHTADSDTSSPIARSVRDSSDQAFFMLGVGSEQGVEDPDRPDSLTRLRGTLDLQDRRRDGAAL